MTTLAMFGGTPHISRPHPHNDLVAFQESDRQAIMRFMTSPDATSSYYGRGGILGAFEDELARFFDRRYAILTNSGTNALHSAFFGLGLEPGDEVIAPTYTFLATVTPLLQLGVVPVLADSEVDTGNIDPEDTEGRITPRTKAIVVTHQWGHPVEMDPIMGIAERHGLAVVEDLSLAFGSTYKGRRVGTIGHVSAFSLGSTKLVSGGQGGALVTDEDEIMERANLVGHFVMRSQEQVVSDRYRPFVDTGYGHNYRMHVLAIAMARSRFHQVEELMDLRRRKLTLLSEALSQQQVVRPPTTRQHVTRGQWGGYTASFDPEEADGVGLELFVEALQAEGLEVSPRGYHPLLHQTAFFQSMDDGFYKNRPFAPNKRIYKWGDFPNAELHVERQIAFPIFLHEDDDLIRAYGGAVDKVVNNLSELKRPPVDSRSATMRQSDGSG